MGALFARGLKPALSVAEASKKQYLLFLPLSKRLDWQESQKEIGRTKWCTMPLLLVRAVRVRLRLCCLLAKVIGVAGGPFHFPKRHHFHAFHS